MRKTNKAQTWAPSEIDPNLQAKLLSFVSRNFDRKEANTAPSVETDSTKLDAIEERLEEFDVFSPDVRSTRLAEFQALLAEDESAQYNQFKATKRTNNKCLTMAGVKPNPNNQAAMPHLY
eukprot:Platyproteum_vivax@DN14498_c0_g1_i1.p1